MSIRHYHIWRFVRDSDGVIRRVEREEAAYSPQPLQLMANPGPGRQINFKASTPVAR